MSRVDEGGHGLDHALPGPESARMTSVVPDRRAVRQALERGSGRVAGLVRDSAPLDGSVPGLDWTRAQLIAHLGSISEACATAPRREEFVSRLGAGVDGR